MAGTTERVGVCSATAPHCTWSPCLPLGLSQHLEPSDLTGRAESQLSGVQRREENSLAQTSQRPLRGGGSP